MESGTVASCVMKIWECLDLSYLSWLLWILYPIILTFLLPLIIVVMLYATALIIWIYSYWEILRDAFRLNIWTGVCKSLAVIWAGHGSIYHGYRVEGLENIPDEGPALIIYYHGVIPIDMYYVMAHCLLKKERMMHAVGDKFLFKIPGWRRMMQVFNVTDGSRPVCMKILSENNLLAIAPGGVREALFGDENYSIMWSKRFGFADVALAANVPVIPMFTENCREAFRTPVWGRKLLRRLYEKTRWPIVPIYGNLPVKLITHFGEPVYPEKNMTGEQFRDLVKQKLEELIHRHQRLPGNIPRALLQRFYYRKKEN